MFCRSSALPALAAGLSALAAVACDQPRTIAGPGAESIGEPVALRLPSLDYAAVDLGTLGGPASVARGINERGHVVGSSSTAAGEDHAFLWTPAAGMVDLGTLPGGSTAMALGINNSGVVVGVARNGAGDERAVLWTGAGEIRDLGAPAGFIARAEGINERGVVVGMARSKTVPFLQHALRWQPDGTMEDLGTLGSRNARFNAINAAGAVVANVDVGPFFTHALFIRKDRTPVDMGNLGGTDPQGGALALALSNRGEVAGFSLNADGAAHAFLWTKDAGMRDLGTLGADPLGYSEGRGINARGMIVGISSAPPFERAHAFLWTSQRGMRGLPTLGGMDSEANAINERGQIVGASDLSGTPVRSHATLWR